MRKIGFSVFFLFSGILLYSQPIFFDSLVGYWDFDNDTETVVIDNSGLENWGTAYNLNYISLPLGKSATFLASDGQIIIPEKGVNPPENISSLTKGSISVWFKFENIEDGQILPILYFGEEEAGTPHNSLIIEIGHSHSLSNRKLYFTIVNQRFCFDSGENLEENQWYHFIAVVDEAGNRGYLNGKLMTNRNYNLGSDSTFTNFFSSVDSAEVLSIGYGRYGIEDPFFHFNGNIDEVAIFDYALNDSEALELYHYGAQKILGQSTGQTNLPASSIKTDIQAYPNPTNGLLTINSVDSIKVIRIIDLTGKEVLYYLPSTNKFTISLEKLPSGMYFIKTDLGQTLKLIKR